MNCPGCNCQIGSSIDRNCPNCGWQFNYVKGIDTPIIGSLARPKQVCEVDLATTVDRTGSSIEFETGIQTTYEMIISSVAAHVQNLRLFLYSHGDLDEGQEIILHTDGGSPEVAIDDIKHVKFGGGGDVKEHHLDAIEYLMNHVPWRSIPGRSHSSILAFMTADSKPCKSGMTVRQLGEEIKKRKVLLYAICEQTPLLDELVRAAGGLMFAISNSPDPGELQVIASQLSASITGSIASKATMPMVGQSQ
jgi:hypothetical protein